jgi:hypothetical protein
MLAGVASRSADRAEVARMADVVLGLAAGRIENSRARRVLESLNEDVHRALS